MVSKHAVFFLFRLFLL